MMLSRSGHSPMWRVLCVTWGRAQLRLKRFSERWGRCRAPFDAEGLTDQPYWSWYTLLKLVYFWRFFTLSSASTAVLGASVWCLCMSFSNVYNKSDRVKIVVLVQIYTCSQFLWRNERFVLFTTLYNLIHFTFRDIFRAIRAFLFNRFNNRTYVFRSTYFSRSYYYKTIFQMYLPVEGSSF